MVRIKKSRGPIEDDRYRSAIAMYEAKKSVVMQESKLISDNYFAIRSIISDASKTGATVHAQLAASAYGSIHASAGVAGSDANSVSYNYSGEVSADVEPMIER